MLRLKVLASAVPLAIAALFVRGEFLTASRACIEIAGTSVQIDALSRRAHHHAGFTHDPCHATVRVRRYADAEAAEAAGACNGHAPPRLVAISGNPLASDPVIYLSRDGPTDDRILVSSNGVPLIVGARQHVEVASPLG